MKLSITFTLIMAIAVLFISCDNKNNSEENHSIEKNDNSAASFNREFLIGSWLDESCSI